MKGIWSRFAMKRLLKFLILGHGDRILLIESFTVAVTVILLLHSMRFNSAVAVLARWSKVKGSEAKNVGVDRIVWAVNSVGRFAPGAENCLVKALSAQLLLARRGY